MASKLKHISQKIGIDKDQDLLEAARLGKTDVIERLVKKRQSSGSNLFPSFLNKQGNVNCVDREGNTPLHLAALNGHKEAVEILLRENAQVNIQDQVGCSPLHLAAWKGYSDICLLLLNNQYEPVHVNIQNNAGDTALHNSSQFGYASTVEVLLQHNADPTIRNLKDDSPLDLAAQFGRIEVVQCLINKYPDLVKSVIPNHSPLHLAAACGHKHIVEMLLDAGFDINMKTENGTALHVAAVYCKVEIVKLLLERGIDTSEVDKDGLTVIQILQQHEKTQTSYTEIISVISEFLKHKGKQQPEGEEAPTYDTVDHRPKPKPRPRPSMDAGDLPGNTISSLYSKPKKDKDNTEDDEKISDKPLVSPTDPPPIPPRQSSIDFPGDTSPVHRTIAEVRQASLLLEDLQPFQAPFTDNSGAESVNRSPQLPPKTAPASRRGVVSMIERASDFKASPPMPRVRSVAPWKSQNDLLGDIPPPPCDGEGILQPTPSGSYLDMSSMSPATARAMKQGKPVKPPRLKKSLSPIPVRSEAAKSSNSRDEESVAKEQSDSISAESSKHQVTDDSAGSRSHVSESNKSGSEETKNNAGPVEEYEVMANVNKVVPPPPCVQPHDNYAAAFSTSNTKRKPISPVALTRVSEGFETENLSRKSEVESKVVPAIPVEYENSANVNKVLNEDVVEYENSGNLEGQQMSVDYVVEYENTVSRESNTAAAADAAKGEITLKRESETKVVSARVQKGDSESRNIPVNDIPDDVNGNTLQDSIPNTSSIPKVCDSKSDVFTSDDSFTKDDSKFLNPSLKGDYCDKDCDTKESRNCGSFTESDLSTQEKMISDHIKQGEKGDKSSEIPVERLSNGIDEDLYTKTQKENSIPKPSSLPIDRKKGSNMKTPLSPTGYHQPPTPDHPPPSPHTAMMGIQQKIHVTVPETQAKRSSKDMETSTESSLLTETDIDYIPDPVAPNNQTGNQSDAEGTQLKVKVGNEEEVVVMRRSRISTGSVDDLVTSDSLRPFEGLLRGSVIGKPRTLASQLNDNATRRSSQRKSGVTFDPVTEEDNTAMATVAMAAPDSRTARPSDDHESEEEWAQIENIMASFGGGIARESVFVRDFEEQFTRQLSKDSSKIQSVGDWLEDIGLGQYENTLVANGFDDTDFLGTKIMDEHDLERIGIAVADHRKKILDAAKTLAQFTPINPDKPPPSVEEWLSSLHLSDYLSMFISKKYDTMERVLKLWEVELTSVLDISALGHRKRILASLENRPPLDRRFPSLKKRTSDNTEVHVPFKDINLYKDYTKVRPITSSEEDIKDSSQNAFPPVDSSEDEEVFRNSQGRAIRDDTIHLRPPHQAHTTSPIKQWRHRPEMLIKGCCNYTAQYLGSTLVRELSGTDSTREGITKLKKSADVIAKIPTIMLSISYKGVKFIDAKSKKVICDHEIGNIFCACQDAESMNFFAYITRDNQTAKHYCHVFNVRNPDMAREIILTLGEAFEVAYQMALKEKAAEEAQEFERRLSERKLSQSDREDSMSISSKASINTV